MTDEEIDAMEAGPRMDALIVKTVFGLEPQECMVGGHPPGCPGSIPITPYSTDIAAAWLVVEKMRERRCLFTQHLMGVDWASGDLKPNTWYAHFDFALHPSRCFTAEADTAPLAICRAALKVVANCQEFATNAESKTDSGVS